MPPRDRNDFDSVAADIGFRFPRGGRRPEVHFPGLAAIRDRAPSSPDPDPIPGAGSLPRGLRGPMSDTTSGDLKLEDMPAAGRMQAGLATAQRGYPGGAQEQAMSAAREFTGAPAWVRAFKAAADPQASQGEVWGNAAEGMLPLLGLPELRGGGMLARDLSSTASNLNRFGDIVNERPWPIQSANEGVADDLFSASPETDEPYWQNRGGETLPPPNPDGSYDLSKLPGWREHDWQTKDWGGRMGDPTSPFDDWIGIDPHHIGENPPFPTSTMSKSRADIMPELLQVQKQLDGTASTGRPASAADSPVARLNDILTGRFGFDLADIGGEAPLLASPHAADDPLFNAGGFDRTAREGPRPTLGDGKQWAPPSLGFGEPGVAGPQIGDLNVSAAPQLEGGATGTPRQQRGAGGERLEQMFNDARLSASQNKAVEMARNNFSTKEIAEELETSPEAVRVFLSSARKRAPDIEIPNARHGPTGGTYGGQPTATLQDLLRVRQSLLDGGHPKGATYRMVAERFGMKPNTVAARLSRYDRNPTASPDDPGFEDNAWDDGNDMPSFMRRSSGDGRQWGPPSLGFGETSGAMPAGYDFTDFGARAARFDPGTVPLSAMNKSIIDAALRGPAPRMSLPTMAAVGTTAAAGPVAWGTALGIQADNASQKEWWRDENMLSQEHRAINDFTHALPPSLRFSEQPASHGPDQEWSPQERSQALAQIGDLAGPYAPPPTEADIRRQAEIIRYGLRQGVGPPLDAPRGPRHSRGPY